MEGSTTKMKILKQIIVGTCSASFLMVIIGFATPGWLIFDVDMHKMQELEMKNQPVWMQKQYKERLALMKKDPTKPDMQDLRVTFGPFYMRYCLTMTFGTISTDICVMLSSGNAIELVETMMRNNISGKPAMQMMEELHKNGINISIESMINMCIAIVVVCSLTLIQSFVSLVLTLVYSCKRYPRKRLGVVGSISLILSGTINFLFVIIYLIMNGQYTNILSAQHLEDAMDLGFPYSPLLCMLGSIMYFVCAGILIYLTKNSKGQYNYEMMIIDTSTGGSTYIAKT
ncbi:uncharacterized protein LOC143045740 isoform X1 [Mytilus galloprovincialis]|uniref:uncharacterized protein LOC143045740 isoform X1 n=3 Tax=Mytilus galloprovincialis TaxID=29158 RepID=UPI003F7C2684